MQDTRGIQGKGTSSWRPGKAVVRVILRWALTTRAAQMDTSNQHEMTPVGLPCSNGPRTHSALS